MPPENKKSRTISFMCSVAEYDEIKALARRSEKPLAEYVRDASLAESPTGKLDAETEIRKMSETLGSLVRVLNELTGAGENR